MKTTFNISELNHDDLVQFLSDASYGNCYILIDYNDDFYDNLPKEKRNGFCIEDKWADTLLNGGKIYVSDLDSDGEVYGTLKHKIERGMNPMGEICKYTTYEVTLRDILAGMNNPNAADYVKELVNESDDMYTGWNLMQVVLFGEVIYG